MPSFTHLPLKKLLFLFLGWRVLLFGLAALAPHFIEPLFAFSYAHLYVSESERILWLHSFANFDGVHYLTIIRDGYIGTGYIQAFFPLYPLVSALVNQLIQSPFYSAFLVANLAAFAVLLLWFSLLQSLFSRGIALLGTFVLLLFPTSFFLGATYSESLFLLLVIATFWFSHSKRWIPAAICIALASATRVVGIFLLPAVLTELALHSLPRATHSSSTAWQQLKLICSKPARVITSAVQNYPAQILALLLSAIGLGSYMLYLRYHFQDPLYFLHVQSEFGAGRSESLILLPQTLWRQIKIIFTVPLDARWFIYVQELVLTLLALGALIFAFFRSSKIKLSWIVFSLGALLLPTATGILSSMPRYLLAAFPIFLVAALLLQKAPRWARYAYFAISAMLLVFNLLRFIQGQWVS